MSNRTKEVKLRITQTITIEQIRALKPEHIYYGANTCWWTHDSKHLRKGSNGLPLDPVGGVLFFTDDVEGFLKAAEDNIPHYGKHGLDAFVAAHHLNCSIQIGYGTKPWASPNWEDYNDGIDHMLMLADIKKRIDLVKKDKNER